MMKDQIAIVPVQSEQEALPFDSSCQYADIGSARNGFGYR